MENILINVDSRFRNKELYPNPGKFTLNLNQTIKDILYIRLSSAEIPNVYYTFSQIKQNVSFNITIGGTTGPTGPTNINIEDGFYNSTNLISSIQSKLPSNMTINLNQINGIITFEYNSEFIIDFTNNGDYPSLGYQLGFRKDIYTSILNILTGKYYIQSEAVLDTNSDNYLLLRINDYGKMYNFYKSTNDYCETLDNYIGKIILSSNKLVTNYDNNNFITKKHIFRQPANISKLDIELLDPMNNTINTNTINFSFTLELGVIYDRELYKQSLNSLNLTDNTNETTHTKYEFLPQNVKYSDETTQIT